MSVDRPRTWVLAIVVIAAVAVVVAGSVVYWLADGQPRSPAAFRDAVAEQGLLVEWTSNGPRGGDGTVDTECGDRDVTVDEIEGALWVRWDGRRELVTPAVVEQIVTCSG